MKPVPARWAFLGLLLLTRATPCPADDNTLTNGELQQRLQRLEQRVDALEQLVAPMKAQQTAAAHRRQQQQKAAARREADRQRYSPEELQTIEQLYASADGNWDALHAAEVLERLRKEFPKANRTGCAMLAFAAASEGKAAIALLQAAMKDYADCYFDDGVQVGAYACYLLVRHHRAHGREETAAKLASILETRYPDAIDHEGRSLHARLQAAD